jgi:hypothetical protein
MINLSQFVDKQVRVTLRHGDRVEGDIDISSGSVYSYIFSYVIENRKLERTYTKNGSYDICTSSSPLDIIQIEEIKPMNRYEELEKQVAEMQKEIDRLKKEEIKVPEIKEIEATRTVIYNPDAYLQYCEESGVTPPLKRDLLIILQMSLTMILRMNTTGIKKSK